MSGCSVGRNFAVLREQVKAELSLADLLRHFFVSNAIEVGVDFKTIAARIAHKDGGMLVAKTYVHLRASCSNGMARLINGRTH